MALCGTNSLANQPDRKISCLTVVRFQKQRSRGSKLTTTGDVARLPNEGRSVRITGSLLSEIRIRSDTVYFFAAFSSHGN